MKTGRLTPGIDLGGAATFKGKVSGRMSYYEQGVTSTEGGSSSTTISGDGSPKANGQIDLVRPL